MEKANHDLSSLLEYGWLYNANHDEARYNQGQSDKRNQEDAASTGWKFASDDPILFVPISLAP